METNNFEQKILLNKKKYIIYNINLLQTNKIAQIDPLPFSARIFLENLIRNFQTNKDVISNDNIIKAAQFYSNTNKNKSEMIAFFPSRVLMQDFTGVPAIVDLAAIRDAAKKLGLDPKNINPLVPVDLVIDHSIQVDHFKTKNACLLNTKKEYQRNKERYLFLKWAQKSFDNLRVVPPSSGICHQVNLEYLSNAISVKKTSLGIQAFPDTLVGTDSHTTMINALGVLGWGVGGIEAEAVMLGQPYYMNLPEIIGVNLKGKPKKSIISTDIAIYLTNRLRKENVVEKLVEYTGEGLINLSLADRATIANMAPEYGATTGFFPIDDNTIDYLKKTNRLKQAKLVEAYCKTCNLFNTHKNNIKFSKTIDIDLSLINTLAAGPFRPQDKILLTDIKTKTSKIFNLKKTTKQNVKKPFPVDGSIVIAAITSCTNTSNPYAMIGAGIAAKNAVKKQLKIPWYVKTSFSPGSKVVIDYMTKAGLMTYLEELGFHNTGFGCTTCIGNSGPLIDGVEQAVMKNKLSVMSVLSGNRNFEARIHQRIKGNFLMSPILVVIYAIAGRIDIDLETEPIGISKNGEKVFFKDIFPNPDQINRLLNTCVKQKFFKNQYSNIFKGDAMWQKLKVKKNNTFKFDKQSTYIKKPPFFNNFSLKESKLENIKKAYALLVLKDSITTDHISPAGAIPKHSPAGKYLIDNKVVLDEFNSYGSRRGNHEVMIRGTFANIRINNQLVQKTGGVTLKFPEKDENFIYDASCKYQKENIDLIVFGGKEYGTGSSRDWAAKGTNLLGIKAVIAVSFERIHKANLIGMGVLPLCFLNKQSFESLQLKGDEVFEITNIDKLCPNAILHVKAIKNNKAIQFDVVAKLNTKIELEYIKSGGILQYVLRKMITT